MKTYGGRGPRESGMEAPPRVWARVAHLNGKRRTVLHRTDLLTPYAAETIAELPSAIQKSMLTTSVLKSLCRLPQKCEPGVSGIGTERISSRVSVEAMNVM